MSEQATATADELDQDSQQDAEGPDEFEDTPVEATDAAEFEDEDAPAADPTAEQPDELEEAGDEPPPEGEAALTPAETPEVAPEPFSFRADGVHVDVDGAEWHGDELRMSREAFQRHVQPHLADRRQWQTREQQWRSRIQQLETSQADEVQRAKLILERVDGLLKDPQALAEFYQNYEANAQRLQLEVENELLKAQNGRHVEHVQSADQQAFQREFQEKAPDGLKSGIAHVLAEDDFKDSGLDPQELQDDLWGMHEAGYPVFIEGKDGDGTGLQPGEVGVNLDFIRATLRPVTRVARKTAAQRKAEEVKARNAKAAGGGAKPPPTAAAKGGGTPSGEKKRPQSREEYLKWKDEKGWR